VYKYARFQWVHDGKIPVISLYFKVSSGSTFAHYFILKQQVMNNKKIAIVIALLITCIVACTKKKNSVNTEKQLSSKELMNTAILGQDSPFIPVDSANRMLTSYLNSLNDEGHENDVHSLIVDANALRAYLQNQDITHVKLMFAHRLDYINNGGKDQYSGMTNNAITIIVGGYNDQNNYVSSPAGSYLDNMQPCPYNCPQNGSAAYDILPQ
jgi:hypothetical protein